MKRKYVRYDLNIVRNAFISEGYRLVSTNYINPHIKLEYICPNGHEHKIAWNKWLYGRRCPYCSEKSKYKIKDIRKVFEGSGYILLTTIYENVFAKLKYICDKGHIGDVTWHNWKTNGARCMECKCEKMFAEGNPNWKGGIACEPYCDVWLDKDFKESIKQRDGYKCMNPYCSGKHKRLSIHHIDYDKKNCNPNNLITLCVSCNSRANKDTKWHRAWYQAIMAKRYEYKYLRVGV